MSISRTTDENGFERIEVLADEGGHITITYYGGVTDVALVTVSNGRGLAHSKYIRNAADFENHIEEFNAITWLEDYENSACQVFLLEMRHRSQGVLKVRDRFDIKSRYVEGDKMVYTFTEKGEFTLHAKVELSITQPDNWDETNAWNALYSVLNPSLEPYESRVKRTRQVIYQEE